MKIFLAKKIGFCFGIKRAFEMCFKALEEKPAPYYMLGPLAHNEHVVEKLKNLGIRPVSSLKEVKKGTIIIPAHGATPEIFQKAKEKNLHIVDATCPLVRRVQNLAKELQDKGYQVIIIGDKNHTEVISIQGSIERKGIVVEKEEEVLQIKIVKPLGVVIQTTQNPARVKKILKELKKKTKKIKVFNTLCPTVLSYQKELKDLVKKVDLILIVGSKTSANTKRLVEIAETNKKPTYLIENSKLDKKLLKEIFRAEKIGIASGTSTPDWLIKEVVKELKQLSSSNHFQKEK